MRLTAFEKDAIRKVFSEIFGDGKVYLFGSRVDDTQKGGDIDLYLSPSQKTADLRKKKIAFLVALKKIIGYQKIDVIIAKDQSRVIEKEALTYGVAL